MGIIDIIIIVFVGLLLLLGFMKGFTKQLFSITAWLVAVAASFFLTVPALLIFMGQEEIPPSTKAIAFIVVFLVAFIVMKIIGKIFSKSIQKGALGILDRLLGGAWGFAKGLIIISLLLLLLRSVIALPLIGEAVNTFITNDMQLGTEEFGIAKLLYEDNLILKIINLFTN